MANAERSGRRRPQGRPQGSGVPQDEELFTKSVEVVNKRFYLDVKQNQRGRFVKIVEQQKSGMRNKVIMSMSTTFKFQEFLKKFIEKYTDMPPIKEPTEEEVQDESIMSEVFEKSTSTYLFDLRENRRGRYLRIKHTKPRQPRMTVHLPAQGLKEVYDVICELLEKFGTGGPPEAEDDLPEPRSMRVDGKMFYFDPENNNRGTFLRISEVRSYSRTAITVPQRAWKQMRDILDSLLDGTVEEQGQGDAPPAEGKPQRKRSDRRSRIRRSGPKENGHLPEANGPNVKEENDNEEKTSPIKQQSNTNTPAKTPEVTA